MSHIETRRGASEGLVLERYWQSLSRPLRLPKAPPPPTVPSPGLSQPLDHPVSLSLRRLIDDSQVEEDPAVLQAHAGGETYAGFLRRQRDGAGPQAIISPRTEQELVTIMLWAAQRDIKILPWGGGTAPYEGKSPSGAPFIVVKLGLMHRLLALNEEEHLVTMQAGATWQSTREIAERQDFTLAKSSLPGSSTLGGTLATNTTDCRSSGYSALTDDIARIRTITPAGPISLQGPASPAKNLLGLMLGSQGSWGIITEVALHLYQKPEKQAYLLANFPSRGAAMTALEEVSQHQHHITAARLIDMAAIELFGSQNDQQRIFTPPAWLAPNSWKARLLLEITGSREAVVRTRRHAEEILRNHAATIEGNGRAAHLKDGLWHHYRPLWRDLWLRGVMTYRLTSIVPWAILPSFRLAWEDALSSVLLSTSGVPGLPITTIHALKHHAQLDTLLLGHQVSGELTKKIQQLEAIQAVATEINRRWNVAFEPTPLVSKALSAARDALSLSNVMLQ